MEPPLSQALITRFGERLKQARRAYRMSQRELADISGVALRTIALIEVGQANPTLETLCKLANVFRLDIEVNVKRRNTKALS